MLTRTKLDQWCNAVIEAGWLAALVVAPLFFNVFSSRVFEPDKISLVRTIALAMTVVWLIKVANGGYAWQPAFALNGSQEPPPGANWRGWVRNPFFIPVTALIVAYLLSTIFSVAGFVSWFGSYQRLQGTYSFLAYVTIGGLAAATLRRPEQLRRVQHAVILTGLACSIYGIVQHYGLDPLPWGGDVQSRVAANAGNAIFLAAYVIMAFFLTLERVFSSFLRLLGLGQPDGIDRQEWQASLAGGAYLFVLLVQTVAIFWTQSRGPWLGWLLAIYLFALLAFTTLRPRFYRIFTGVIVGAALLGVFVLLAANTIPSFSFVRDIPYLGRLTNLLELDTGTGRVRALIWSGSAEMMLPHDPLVFPDGAQDTINAIRPLVGYGPEAMWVAFNRFYPPDLAHVEARNASPDRSHNETWDSMVVTGLLGFVTYTAVILTLLYWALRWLGLIVKRRDSLLFAAVMALSVAVSLIGFYFFDQQQLRLFGLAMPFGLMGGLALFVSIAAFLHGDTRPARADLPRLMLIIGLLTAIVAHYFEIHFGIAIGATRTSFWVFTAMLMVLGMRLAQPQAEELLAPVEETAPAEVKPAVAGKGKGKTALLPRRPRQLVAALPMLPATVMTDLLIFLTFVYIYSTNAQGSSDPLSILFTSVLQRPVNGQLVSSPAIFFLMFFTWLIGATVALAGESLAHRRAASVNWWLRGYGLHAAVVWGGWLFYGMIQGWRLAPMSAPPGTSNQDFLNMQLDRVGGHFGFFTGVVIVWMLGAGVVYAWPWLRQRGLPVAGRPLLAAGAGIAGGALALLLIVSVNINLVMADIVYKQGQQFDAQGNWVSSVELYRRALATRKTEDHYMLFLGRALLEQAKQAPVAGTASLPATLTLDDVLALTPDVVAQLGREDLLRAAEAVLLDAQKVNPLNTDHTANLARLYRTWADLVAADSPERGERLAESLAMYETAVTLSPNAAHLWNERGNAYLALGDNENAMAAYEKSLSLDQLYDQTYLLMADMLDRTGQTEALTDLLDQAVATFTGRNNDMAVQMLSYLSVVQARSGDLASAAATNERILELAPGNATALRNLAVIARDQGDLDAGLAWAEQGIAANTGNVAEVKPLYQVAAEIQQLQGNLPGAIATYEQLRTVDPNDTTTLQVLLSFYVQQGEDAKVVEIAQALAALDPANFLHPWQAAQALLRLNRAQEALPFAQQALTLAGPEQQPAIEALIQQITGGQ